eukprot:comp231_c0_seq1/m.159 comp231_c0_seq1/g.159  ORF comp231_c0_seq1/g.159 comp231_c0_seq1/m.159 type:complete len:141 (+) comp231_c0_seq1:2-424(+)
MILLSMTLSICLQLFRTILSMSVSVIILANQRKSPTSSAQKLWKKKMNEKKKASKNNKRTKKRKIKQKNKKKIKKKIKRKIKAAAKTTVDPSPKRGVNMQSWLRTENKPRCKLCRRSLKLPTRNSSCGAAALVPAQLMSG